ncbi:hypothetical protein [Burkholderia ambifaria]|uniref:hypothetical protein n=1 Tax=Burkholderia ambifaria TaxID=152480 RepID=UPI000B064A12|nr:hypothetical protein [Burkholderia ambifaria]
MAMTPGPCNGHDTESPTHAAGRPLIATPALADVTSPPWVVDVPRVATNVGIQKPQNKLPNLTTKERLLTHFFGLSKITGEKRNKHTDIRIRTRKTPTPQYISSTAHKKTRVAQ